MPRPKRFRTSSGDLRHLVKIYNPKGGMESIWSSGTSNVGSADWELVKTVKAQVRFIRLGQQREIDQDDIERASNRWRVLVRHRDILDANGKELLEVDSRVVAEKDTELRVVSINRKDDRGEFLEATCQKLE